MNDLRSVFKKTICQIHIGEFWISLFFAIVAMLWRNPLNSSTIAIESFDRKIGPGIIQNSDVAKIISNFREWFWVLVLVWLVLYMVLSIIRERKSEEVWNYILKWLPFAYVALFLKCIWFFSSQLGEKDGREFYACNLVSLILFLFLIYYIFSVDKKLPIEFMERSLVCSLSCAIPCAMLFDRQGEIWNTAYTIFVIVFVVSSVLFYVASKSLSSEKANIFGNIVVILVALFPTFTFIYIEAINVLNQYEIFINRPLLWYKIVSLCYLIMIIVVSLIVVRRLDTAFSDWKSFSYPITIVGMQLMGIQFGLTAMYNQDLMESANYGVIISNFLTTGKIPIVESYGGHQLENVLEGLLYAFINQDYAGAVFSPYANLKYVFIILFLYLILKNIFDKDIAFRFVLFVPFMGNVYYWGIGLIVVLAFNKFLKRQSYGNIFILWLACVFSVLYRLDLGYSFTIAMIVTMICYLILEKKWEMVKKILLPLIGIGIVGVVLWIVICLFRDINPISRLMEFLNISFSNKVWGRASLGNENTMVFVVAYILLPICVLFSLIYMLIKQEELRQNKKEAFYLCFMLGIAYITNFSRGLVRHSMFENITFVAYWCAFMYLAVWISFCKKKSEMIGGYFIVLVILNQMLLGQNIYTERAVITSAAVTENDIANSWKQKENNYWGLLQEKVQRTEWSEELKESALPLETICELFLNEEETYAELLNKDFLYAVLLRESPVYMCQSPLLVSGEFTQEALAEEIAAEECPIVLLPSSQADGFEVQTDGTANNIRNYKLMEYIYQNYRPLLGYDDTAVWCLPDRYEEYKHIAEEYMLAASPEDEGYVPMELVDYGYDEGNEVDGEIIYYPFLHQYDLYDLAMIWGNFDKEEAWENTSLTVPNMNEKGVYVFDVIETEEKVNGNYLLINMDNPGDETYVCVELGIYEEDVFNEKYEFVYRTDSDMKRYLIRISSDYYWYTGNINAVRIRDTQGNVLRDVKLDVLQGD